jgi:hypothetical protein
MWGIKRADGKFYAGEHKLPPERVPYWNSLLSSATRFANFYDASMTAGLITARKEDRCDVIEMADRASPHNISLDL